MADPQLYHIYGIRNDLPDILFFVDETNIVYAAGAHIVLHNCESNAQKFIPLSDNGNKLTAMAMARGQFLAYAETTAPFATIVIFDLSSFRKKRTLVTNEVNSPTYTAIDFSDSGKQIAGLGGAPEFNLVYWWWEKTKVIGTTKVGQEAKVVKICPKDANRIAVCGTGMLKIFRVDENQLKLEPKSVARVNEYFDFVSLAWVSEFRMLLGTAQGQVVIWEDGTLVSDILDPGASLSLYSMKVFKKEGAPNIIDHLILHPHGFLCSSSAGTLKYFDISNNGIYTHQKDLKILIEDKALEYGILDEQRILDLTISPSGETVAVATDKRQIFSVKLRDMKRSKDDYYKMKPLCYLLHNNPVHAIDISVRKPLIVTCAADRTVRIWNFYNRGCEIWKKFPEEPHSVAIHPSGFYLLAGFTDKLKMMHILNDDIRTVRELPIRGCREVKFSYGGHLFAAANGSIIQIFSTIQFDNIVSLKGHTSRIRCIVWTKDDFRIFSSSQDGSLFEWNVTRGEIIHEIILRGTIFVSIAPASDAETVLAVTADGTLREIAHGQTTRTFTCPLGNLTFVSISQFGKTALFGTVEGKILLLPFPIPVPDEGENLTWIEIPAHQKEITKATLSHDDQLLITASADGNVFVWKVGEGDLAKVLRRDKPSPYADEILIEKKELEQRNVQVLDLTTKAEEIQLENEYQKRAKDAMYSEKIKDITDSFTKEIDLLKTKNEKQALEKDQAEQQHQQEMTLMIAKFNHDLLEQERITNQKLLLEYEKYAELIIEKEKQETDFKDQIQEVAASKEDAIERLTVHYETKIESLHSILDKTQKEFADYMKEHDELRHMIEEDSDMEIIDIRARYETAIFELKESNMRLKGENGVMKKKINNLLKDIDDHKAEVMKFQADLAKQMSVTKGLEKEIESWKKELKEREENVQDKEKRIHELKKKNQELEKFKFVLDFKIKELRKQIEPKDDEITEQNKKIKELEEQIESLDIKILDLKSDMHTLNTTLEFTRRERDKAGQGMKERDTFIRRFQGEMEYAVRSISDAQKFRHAFLAIYEKFMVPSGDQSSASICDGSTDHERALAKENLELKTAVADTRLQYQRKNDVLSRKLWNMMQQNTNLIEEINVFRREMTALRTRLNLLDTAVQGINPKRKDEFTKIQMLLKDIEESKMAELEKTGVIDLYRHELRRLHLLLILMRKVLHNDTGPGVQEVISKLQEVQLPPLVGQSKIDLVSDVVVSKVTHAMNDLTQKYPGTHRPRAPYGHRAQGPPKEPATTQALLPIFPKPGGKAEVPPKQLQFLQGLMGDSEQPPQTKSHHKVDHHAHPPPVKTPSKQALEEPLEHTTPSKHLHKPDAHGRPHLVKTRPKQIPEEPAGTKADEAASTSPDPAGVVTIIDAAEVPPTSPSPEPPATSPEDPQGSSEPVPDNTQQPESLPGTVNSPEGEVASPGSQQVAAPETTVPSLDAGTPSIPQEQPQQPETPASEVAAPEVSAPEALAPEVPAPEAAVPEALAPDATAPGLPSEPAQEEQVSPPPDPQPLA